MAALNLPEPFAGVDVLTEQGDFAAARTALGRTQENPALRELCEVKIALFEGSLPPQIAMNRLLALMQRNPELPGAHDLYREASTQSYEGGFSSLSHSHPPPPIKLK